VSTEPVEQSTLGLGAVGAAVTLMGIGSVLAKAAEIDGPVLGFHRAWGAAVVYGLLLLATGGRITIEKLGYAAPGGLIFGAQLALFFSAIQLTTVANATMLLALQPVVVLLFFYALLGMFLDGTSIIVMTLPITLPLVTAAGYDPIWFGIFIVVAVEISQITPPIGFNLFVIQAQTGEKIGVIARAALPFFFILLLFALLLALVPQIALWLPATLA